MTGYLPLIFATALAGFAAVSHAREGERVAAAVCGTAFVLCAFMLLAFGLLELRMGALAP